MAFEKALEPELVAAELIPEHHPHLEAARIAYLFTEGPLVSRGAAVLAKSQTASGLMEHFAAVDFVLVFDREGWTHLTDGERAALVDHHLCACAGKADKDGEIHWSIRAPDVQEFREVIDRHGLWDDGLRDFAKRAARWAQPPLPFTEPAFSGTDGGEIATPDSTAGPPVAPDRETAMPVAAQVRTA